MDSAIENDVVISLSGVSKCFRRYGKPIDRLKEVLLNQTNRAEDFWVLNDLAFEVKRGETVGILGQNGSGKSTLLQMIAGTLHPTQGNLSVRGKVSALLELGSGFNPEFTGRQNVFFNGRILGLTQTEIEERFDTIAAFADIGNYIDQPVKTYSSGMFVRLAFAVAVHVDPDIFIVDEALAVGDIIFQHRCMRKIKSLMDAGATTLFVSHDAGAVKALCSRAIMLHGGRIYTIGSPDQVINTYLKKMTEIELGTLEGTTEQTIESEPESIHPSQEVRAMISPQDKADGSLLKPTDRGHDLQLTPQTLTEILKKSLLGFEDTRQRGSGKVKLLGVALFNPHDEWAGLCPTVEFDQRVTLITRFQAIETLDSWILGVLIRDKNGYEILGFNTHEESVKSRSLTIGEEIDVSFTFQAILRPGSYSLSIAVTESYTSVTAMWLNDVLVMQVLSPSNGRKIFGVVDIPVQVNVRQSFA